MTNFEYTRITIIVPYDDMRALKKIAGEQGITMSELTRKYIQEKLKEENNETK